MDAPEDAAACQAPVSRCPQRIDAQRQAHVAEGLHLRSVTETWGARVEWALASAPTCLEASRWSHTACGHSLAATQLVAFVAEPTRVLVQARQELAVARPAEALLWRQDQAQLPL